jgi:hypothetical protein
LAIMVRISGHHAATNWISWGAMESIPGELGLIRFKVIRKWLAQSLIPKQQSKPVRNSAWNGWRCDLRRWPGMEIYRADFGMESEASILSYVGLLADNVCYKAAKLGEWLMIEEPGFATSCKESRYPWNRRWSIRLCQETARNKKT